MPAELSYDELLKLPDDALLERVRLGSECAERILFDRYYLRLVRYAQGKMDRRLQRVEPASDVVQSAMKSVLLGIPLQEFNLERGEDLWPLLVAITLNKIRNRWKKYTTARRDITRNVPYDEYDLLLERTALQSEPELNDLVEQLLAKFLARRRKIIELVLQGYHVSEIASELGISERTVYATRRQAMASLRELLDSERIS